MAGNIPNSFLNNPLIQRERVRQGERLNRNAEETLLGIHKELDRLPAVGADETRLAKFTVGGRTLYRPVSYLRSLALPEEGDDRGVQLDGSDEAMRELLQDEEDFAGFATAKRPVREAEGGFFNGYISPVADKILSSLGINMVDYQIYTDQRLEIDPKLFNNNCIYHVLKQIGTPQALDVVSSKNAKVSDAMATRCLSQIANASGLVFRLTVARDNANTSRYYRKVDDNDEFKVLPEDNAETAKAKRQAARVRTRGKAKPKPKKEFDGEAEYEDGEEVIQLGLIRDHYFLNETVKVMGRTTRGLPMALNLQYYAKNKKLETMMKTYTTDAAQRGFFERNRKAKKEGSCTVFQLIQALTAGGYIHDLPEELRALTGDSNVFTEEAFIPKVPTIDPEYKPPAPKKGFKEPEFDRVWYADTEATTDGDRHYSYLACAISRDGDDKVSHFADSGACKNMLKKAVSLSPGEGPILFYFHNLKYDANHLYECLYGIKTTEANGRIYELSGMVYNTNYGDHDHDHYGDHDHDQDNDDLKITTTTKRMIVCRDTYSFIQTKLSEFPRMFNIPEDEGKDLEFVYGAFTRESVRTRIPALPIPDRWSGPGGMVEYATSYCFRDCEVMKRGFEQFRNDCVDNLNIDPDQLLTAASLAKRYIKEQGCLDGVVALKGCVREYVQQTVVGGRVMVRKNKKGLIRHSTCRDDQILDVDAVSLYPSAMVEIEGFPTGNPQSFVGDPPMDGRFYCATVVLDDIETSLNFPTLSIKENVGGRKWADKDLIGKTMILNSVQIADAVKYQGAVFSYLGGLIWPGWNTKIRDCMRNLFQWRLKLKKEKNPLQVIIKLIMNSAYGKLVERPHEESVKWIYCSEKKALTEAARKGTGLIYVEQCNSMRGDDRCLWKLRFRCHNFEHSSYPHAGGLVLAASKSIMYRAMVPIDHEISYTDTDSIQVTKRGLNVLKEEFPDLVGTDMGQFHDDFDWKVKEGQPKPKQVYAVNAAYLGKKIYCAELATDTTGDERQYHIRAKGIPTSCIRHMADKLEITPLELYEKMMYEAITFDLTATGVKFKQHASHIRTITDFTRTIGPFAEGSTKLAKKRPKDEPEPVVDIYYQLDSGVDVYYDPKVVSDP